MKNITVVGCGIIGLTTAIALQEKGFQVKLVAKEKFESTLSHKVGAIWFPFEVHPIQRATQWASDAYKRYKKEVRPENGVSFIPFTVVCNEHSDTSWTKKLPLGSVHKATKKQLPKNAQLGYVATVPLAEPPRYLPHLFTRFIKMGGSFKTAHITELKSMAALDDIVVNCTGLGAKDLCNDTDLTAMRGQILRAKKISAPSCVNSTESGSLSYIIQRSTDCIIGGTDYLEDYNLAVMQSDTDLILNRIKAAGLSSETPEILETLVGLRPRRKAVRFEFDAKYPNIFHNYGHGGAGFTVAWGCALELTQIMLRT